MRKKYLGIVGMVMLILFMVSPILADELQSEDDFFTGFRPSTIDRSHLQKNPPRLKKSLPEGNVGASLLPSYYDLREHNGVTDVRKQDPWGTCWVFSALGSLESSYKKQYPWENPDFSEMFIAYFTYGDSRAGKSFNLDDPYKPLLRVGGNGDQVVALLSRLGVVDEYVLPYPNTDYYTRPSKFPEEYETPLVRLKETYQLGELTYDLRTTVKELVMNKGAVGVSYYLKPNTYGRPYKSSGYYVYFDPYTEEEAREARKNKENSNAHAVCIVGWDDNFPRSRFTSYTPNSNGAWLIRNSHGIDASSGYFWMSYEQFINGVSMFVADRTEKKLRHYGYDDLGRNGTHASSWGANIFKAEASETLKYVGFYTTDNNESYIIDVYDLGTSWPSSPTNGKRIASMTSYSPYEGYHTEDFTSINTTLTKGHYFSVVMKMGTSQLAVEGHDEAVIDIGESYYSNDGESWYDLGANYHRNACIKAFTAPIKISDTFPDPRFREYVSYWDTNNDGYFSDEEIDNVKDFGWYGGPHPENEYENAWAGWEPKGVLESRVGKDHWKGIKSIEGVKIFRNLEALYVYNDSITGTVDISGLTKLKDFRCHNDNNTGGITGINAEGCSSLEIIHCRGNKVTYINRNGCNALVFVDIDGIPKITTTSLPDAYYGEEYNARIYATGSAPITYNAWGTQARWSGFLIDGQRLDGAHPTTNGLINGTINTTNPVGARSPYNVEITVTAENEWGKDEKTFTVVMKEKPVKPAITTSSLPDAYIGTSYSATLTATGTTPITYQCTGAAAMNNGFLLDGNNFAYTSTNGLINGTITNPRSLSTPFTVNINVTASNGGGSDTKTLPVTIYDLPSISYTFKDSKTGQSYSDYVTVSGGKSSYTWTKQSGSFPDGLSMSSSGSSLYLKGTPTKAGTYNFSLKVKDVNGKSATKSFTITITPSATAPSITTTSLPDGYKDESYAMPLSATGTTPISWSATGLPSGLSCSSSGTISGTPSSSSGTYSVTLSASNVAGSVSKTLSLTIRQKAIAPTITTMSLPDGRVDESYSVTLSATGTTPITWSATGLPPGLSCSSSGTISGTPTTSVTFSVTVTAKNTAGSTSKTLIITIMRIATAPTITTSSLSDGYKGESYSVPLSATGTEPITWSATGLPSGLSCSSSGTISGTPSSSSSGTYSVRVTASNVAGSESKSLTLNIAAKQETITNEDDITETEKPKFKVANLTLSGQIAVNFYMNLPQIQGVNYYDGRNCYTDFDINGDTTGNNPQPVDSEFMSDGNYGFKCYVTSIQMADPITATFHYGNGKSVQCEYSVKKYLDNRISKTTSETMKNLAIAIKNYGHYAQIYLARVNGWTLGDSHIALEAASDYTASDIESVRSVIDKYGVTMDSLEGTGIKGISYSLSLNADTTINLTLKIKPEYTGSVSAYLNGGRENLAVKQSDGNYKVQIGGISAHQLADTQTVKVYAGKEVTLKVSGLTFVYTSMKGSNIPEDRQKLAVALYRYYETTMAYRNAQ